MTKQMKTHHRVVGALVGAWLTIFMTSLLLVGFSFITVPLAAALGATRAAQRFARPGLTLAGSTITWSLITTTVVGGPLGIIVTAAVTVALWMKLDDLDTDHGLRPAVA